MRSQGKGRPIIFLHGWALNSRVWDNIVSELSDSWQVIAIDLPGHGKSDLPGNGRFDLDTLVDEIAKLEINNAVWAGWSLGGMVALEIARKHPQLVSRLVLIAGSPQFVASDDWPHAVSQKTVNEFAKDLIKDYRSTILRFLAIQALGSQQAKQAIRALKEKVFINGEPHTTALEQGLDLLMNTSLLEAVKEIDKPVQIILGEKDTLIPVSSGAITQSLIPGSRLAVIPGAGHAPFVSHTKEFLDVFCEFIND